MFFGAALVALDRKVGAAQSKLVTAVQAMKRKPSRTEVTGRMPVVDQVRETVGRRQKRLDLAAKSRRHSDSYATSYAIHDVRVPEL